MTRIYRQSKRIFISMLILLLLTAMLSTSAFAAAPQIEATYEYSSTDGSVTAKIAAGESADKLEINVTDFIDNFTLSSDQLYPGLLQEGTLKIDNQSKYDYKITGMIFNVNATDFERTLNDATFDAGLTAEGAATLTDSQWFTLNEDFYDLAVSYDMETLREMFGLNTLTDAAAKYPTNKIVGQKETHATMQALARELLYKKAVHLSFDTTKYPLYNKVSEHAMSGLSLADYLGATAENQAARSALSQPIAAGKGVTFNIGYALDAEYFVNAFQNSDLTVDFTLVLEKVTEEPTPTPKPNDKAPQTGDNIAATLMGPAFLTLSSIGGMLFVTKKRKTA